jgi:hypothetical protein
MTTREYHCIECARVVKVTGEQLAHWFADWFETEPVVFPSSVKCGQCSGGRVKCYYPLLDEYGYADPDIEASRPRRKA